MKKVTGLADGLKRAGLRRGERVGIHLDTSVVQALSIFGVSQAGGVFVPINSLLFPEQVAHIARDCQMRGLITTRQKLTSLSSVLTDVPSLEFVVVTGDSADTEIRQQVYELPELFDSTICHNWQEVAIGRDLAAILYTSAQQANPKESC